MTRSELAQQRAVLLELAKRMGKNVAELERETAQLKNMEGEYGEGEKQGDDQEVINQAMEEHVAKHLLGNQEFTLSEVEAALERMKKGTYGKCSECGQPVGMERLQALPYARRCIGCAKSLHG